jgi:hypothetical protein
MIEKKIELWSNKDIIRSYYQIGIISIRQTIISIAKLWQRLFIIFIKADDSDDSGV